MTADDKKHNVLVLDGEQRAALAVVRSLVRARHEVHVAAGSEWAIAARSRGAKFAPIHIDPLADAAEYALEVTHLAQDLRCDVTLPITDASMSAVLMHPGDEPRGSHLPGPSLQSYLAASDKVRVHEAAAAVGLAIDETAVIESPTAQAPESTELYPGVVKPHRSIVIAGEQRLKTRVQLVRDREECERVLATLPPETFPVLVQRRVRGPGIGVFVGRWHGRTFARFAHRRLREKPPSGGISVFSEGIALPPGVSEAADALLDAFEWQGVAMVELKGDSDAGGWRVMEINGRFWGSLQLAIDSGVDFPALLLAAMDGSTPSEPPQWMVGRRLRWEWGDVDHLLLRLLRSRERLRLGAEAPSRLRVLGRFLWHHPGRDSLELLRLRDPMPFVAETLERMRLRK